MMSMHAARIRRRVQGGGLRLLEKIMHDCGEVNPGFLSVRP